jgi:hypothetical protein
MKKLLLSCLTLLSLTINAQSPQKQVQLLYKDAETILSSLKENSNEAVNGPFLLTIKSITSYKNNIHLNSQINPTEANNIVIELPPFMVNYYRNNYKSGLETLYLNQNLIVKGQAKWTEYIQTEGDKQSSYNSPTIKIILPEQLGHYD